ncbi:hypothetical protein JI739_12790 [Ramlibacter sp. AW1]|uniref:Sporulation protein n=1 Tax=Ramlibacter aurantiacus TaxID=2801330 RepID=A0A936ZJ91_9BURK|nr:hypothetical protein [Ramlibacter aurantiacus]MBL0421228.1 hypothetical protein [Ramlibacter aurantiacus]
MLRTFVLLLLLLNAAWFAWAQGLLRPWGLGPAEVSEPYRLEQQVRPELLRVQPRAESAAAVPRPPARVQGESQ